MSSATPIFERLLVELGLSQTAESVRGESHSVLADSVAPPSDASCDVTLDP